MRAPTGARRRLPIHAVRCAALMVGLIVAAGCAAPDRSSGSSSGSGSGLANGARTGSTTGSADGAPPAGSTPSSELPASPALDALAGVEVKGRAPKTGYDRDRFGPAWADVDHNGCDTRNDILDRDLTDRQWRDGTHGCVVVAGMLADPYTGRTIPFTKADASAVQIDHVVALSDAWQKGAQTWTDDDRLRFANDPLNLLAVDGPTNQAKGDGDAATWLPPNRAFRCRYVARQIAVKTRWHLWMTAAERDASARILRDCPGEAMPV